MNLIEKELFKRKIKSLPSEYLEKISHLDEEEYEYLGEPAVIIEGYLTYRCNCLDNGKFPLKDGMKDRYCLRCKGREYYK